MYRVYKRGEHPKPKRHFFKEEFETRRKARAFVIVHRKNRMKRRRKTQQCEAPGCESKPFKQVSILDHLFEGLWCCEECIKDPLGLKKNRERTELDDLTDELKVKREEYLVTKRRLDEEKNKAKRVVNEQEFKVREGIFKSLVTMRTPRPLLEYWAAKHSNKYTTVTPEELEQELMDRRSLVPTVEDLVFGGYSCPASPTGNCIYDDCNDHMHDNCLFCGEPEERK